MTTIKYCMVTATKPKCVAKKYSLDNGVLVKKTSANVSEGEFCTRQTISPDDFASMLLDLGHNQCLVFGLPPRDAKLVTEEKWIHLGKPLDQLPRTAEIFDWSKDTGIMLLDKDAPKDGSPTTTRAGLFELLYAACPLAKNASSVWLPSSSSHIYQGDEDLTGLRGQHIYLFVEDASDIPRAGKALNDRLWAKGHGTYEVSTNGALLKRSVFDETIWQTNKIDFAAGAMCGEGLQQKRGLPVVQNGQTFLLLDTRRAIPDLTAEEKLRAEENQKKSREQLQALSVKTKDQWIEEKSSQLMHLVEGMSSSQAATLALRALETRYLPADWMLTVEPAPGLTQDVTVGEVLRFPERYNGLITLDPIEPEYDGRRFVGKLFLLNGRPNLNSFAHGGRCFRLQEPLPRIQLISGKTKQAIDELLVLLRLDTEIFDFGQNIVRIGDRGALHTLTDNSLRYVVGGIAQFFRVVKHADGELREMLKDPPATVTKPIIDLREARKLKLLNGVITAPTLRPDGSLLQVSGYDAATRLYLDLPKDKVSVPVSPSLTDVAHAIDTLWMPFKDFPFCSAQDRAVHLAALLTAGVRGVLPAAPGFAYDAPIQGSGKTLLARCVGVLVNGAEPSVWPHTAGVNDEEIRKRIFTVLSAGARVLIWDNVVGSFDSAALASSMTSPSYTDRVLGKSDSSTVPNRMMLILTGNNIQLQGEMPRRVLVCRIDPATDKPFAREFSLDPFEQCLQNRQVMIAAGLTLIRGFITHGCSQPISGKLASFEDWDQWVRRSVLFANEIMPGMFGDVMDVVKANQAVDPEQESLINLLRALHRNFSSSPFHTADVIQKIRSISAFAEDAQLELAEAVDGLPMRDTNKLNAKSLGRYFANRKDRWACGFCLQAGRKIDDKQSWVVVKVAV